MAALSDFPWFFLLMEPIHRCTPVLKEVLTVKLIERGSLWHALPRHKIDFLVEISMGVGVALITINLQLISVPFGGEAKAVGQ